MAQLSFGPAAIYGERVDNVPLPTALVPRPQISGQGPIQFGICQKIDVNWSYTDKPLYGQLQFPVAVARGQGKIDGKITAAQMNALLYSDIFFGLTAVPGQFSVEPKEITTVAGGYTVINAATYLDDLGVIYKANGNHFVRKDPATTGAGTYTVDLTTGTYGFDAADTGLDVIISYAYSTAVTGFTLPITNQLAGITPSWKATFIQQVSPGPPNSGTQDQPFSLRLNACVSSKLMLPNTAIDAWQIPELDFSAFADAAGDIGQLSLIQP